MKEADIEKYKDDGFGKVRNKTRHDLHIIMRKLYKIFSQLDLNTKINPTIRELRNLQLYDSSVIKKNL